MEINISDSKYIKQVRDYIVATFEPQKIYIYSLKNNLDGDVTSFKLCVVMETENKPAAERKIYFDIDCDIPFDVIIYTPTQWAEISQQSFSFANKISAMGVLIYG